MSYRPAVYDEPRFAGMSELEIERILAEEAEVRNEERFNNDVAVAYERMMRERAEMAPRVGASSVVQESPDSPSSGHQDSSPMPVPAPLAARAPSSSLAPASLDEDFYARFAGAMKRLGSVEERREWVAGQSVSRSALVLLPV